MMGPEQPIPDSRLSVAAKLHYSAADLAKLKSRKLRPPGPHHDVAAFKAMLDTTILIPFLRLDIMDAEVNPASAKKMLYACGLTTTETRVCIRVQLAKQEIAPLLRNDLTSSMRLAEQLAVANTLVHEMMHAYNSARNIHISNLLNDPEFIKPEPYFEDEVCSELGCSAESALFDGMMAGFLSWKSKPRLGYFHKNWPEPDPGVLTPPVLTSPSRGPWSIYKPLPVSYYEMIQSKDFWTSHFRSFGSIRKVAPPLMAVQDTSMPRRDWSVQTTDPNTHPIVHQVEPLLQITPAERAYRDNALKEAKIAGISALIRGRNSLVKDVIDQSERCDMVMHSPQQHNMYLHELGLLHARLRALTVEAAKLVQRVKDLEIGGPPQVGKCNCAFRCKKKNSEMKKETKETKETS